MKQQDLELFSTNEEQLELDQRIAELNEEIRSCKTRRNACSPSHLPAELLCKIFMELLHDPYLNQQFMNNAPSSPLLWARVSHVSRHWRQTALGHSQLWARVSTLYPPSWIEALLERSGNAPLEVRSTYAFMHSSPALSKEILRRCHKLTSLTFARKKEDLMESSQPSTIQQLCDLLANPLPSLETLVMTDMMEQFREYTTASLPSTFLAAGAPKLRRLELSGWAPPQWTSPSFRGLVSLIVETLQYSFSLLDVLQGLANMPELATVELEVKHASHTAILSTRHPTVVLPCLKSFRISFDRMWGAADFLEHLALPSSASLSISIVQQPEHDSDDDEDLLGRLFQSLYSSWLSDPLGLPNCSNPQPILSLKVHHYEDHLYLDGWLHLLPHGKVDIGLVDLNNSHLHLDVCADIDIDDEGHKIPYKELPLPCISELCFDGPIDSDLVIWLETLEVLKSLRLANASAQALFHHIKDELNGTPPASFLPCLDALSIEKFKLPGPGPQVLVGEPDGLVHLGTDLLYFLQRRVESGKMVGKVRLECRDNISDQDIEEIKGLCTDFESSMV
ncbi:hypothetical protein BKA70DRAFT_1145318 [Coprinopsis sp. MPI-PUGE-AT-0042]|nr:hypothetical protein BKA70DRAFT_1145318 [Coprinopsis sp. MPI-PUGE-AT-0042]